MKRLAILDWGVGGFGFWKEWKKLRPYEGIVYFSDSGFTPYGKVPDDELTQRLQKVIGDLHHEHGITHCLIACHSASTVAHQLSCPGITISGIIEGTTAFIKDTIPPGPLGLAGGRRTIGSQTYHRLLPEYEVLGLIAQPLSAAVEAGQLSGPEIHELVASILQGTPKHLVLACTHYIALHDPITSAFPEVTVHDPIPFIASSFSKSWPEMATGDFFHTSGSLEEMKTNARAAFQVQLS